MDTNEATGIAKEYLEKVGYSADTTRLVKHNPYPNLGSWEFTFEAGNKSIEINVDKQGGITKFIAEEK